MVSPLGRAGFYARLAFSAGNLLTAAQLPLQPISFHPNNDKWKNRDQQNAPLKTIAEAAPIAPKNGA